MDKKIGYHIADIPKGKLGEISKIEEEFQEFLDAHNQGVRVMELVELSDMIGAIQAYLDRHHGKMEIADLIAMHKVTKRAFENGFR